MKYFSMFSGIGGFDLALNRQGHNCIGYSEISEHSIKTYKKNFGKEVKNYGDATKINPEELPDFDILCGGFPCQAFSIAGKRMGFEDTRGTLFFDIARISKVKRPRFLFLENVKGLLSHNKGRTFVTILATLDELGYNVEWQVLNSKYFGVPQNRERVFIIGHLRGTSSGQVFPIEECGGEAKELVYAQKSDREIARIYSPEGVSPCLHLKTGNCQAIQPIIYPTLTTELAHSTGRDFFRTGGQKMLELGQIRRLTPVECERLQGFPDNWTEGVSDTQRYNQIGNAVTVNVIEEISKKLNEVTTPHSPHN